MSLNFTRDGASTRTCWLGENVLSLEGRADNAAIWEKQAVSPIHFDQQSWIEFGVSRIYGMSQSIVFFQVRRTILFYIFISIETSDVKIDFDAPKPPLNITAYSCVGKIQSALDAGHIFSQLISNVN